MKKFMIDSNVIIEYMKNNYEAVKIINYIKNNPNYEYYITLETIEEILYILLKHFSKKSYWDLKNNTELSKHSYKKIVPLIKNVIKNFFKITLQTETTHHLLFKICETYGLLPKDALIIVACLENNVNNLITFYKELEKEYFEE